MNANKQLRRILNQRLERLDQKLKAAVLKGAENDRKRKGMLADIRRQTKKFENLREEFNRLSNRREVQKLETGKINPNFKEVLVDMARRSEPIERHLNFQKQILAELIEEGKECDREIIDLEAKKQFYLKIKDNAMTFKALRANILNEK